MVQETYLELDAKFKNYIKNRHFYFKKTKPMATFLAYMKLSLQKRSKKINEDISEHFSKKIKLRILNKFIPACTFTLYIYFSFGSTNYI